MTFQPKRRFGQRLFQRNQRKRKNQVEQSCSSQMNLLNDVSTETKIYDSRKLRHFNTDGSSCDQLKDLLDQLPQDSKSKLMTSPSSSKEETSEKRESESDTKTLKSDGSSGRELQLILEKLMLEENKHKQIRILPEYEMQEKKIGTYDAMDATRTPPLQQASRGSTDSTSPSTPNRSSNKRQEESATPNSQTKFRFEMVDPNEQTKLFLKLRQKKRKKKRRTTKKEPSNHNDNQNRSHRLLNNCGIKPGLEVREDSLVSMSSCSIDSALDERNCRQKQRRQLPLPTLHQNRKNQDGNKEMTPEHLSCNAFQLANDIRTTVFDTYGMASTWIRTCLSNSPEKK